MRRAFCFVAITTLAACGSSPPEALQRHGDAGPEDAMDAPKDATVTPMDAMTAPMDAMTVPMDAMTAPMDAMVPPQPDAGTTTIRAGGVKRNIDERGRETVAPIDISFSTFEALIENNGVFRHFPGQMTAPGEAIVPNVPLGMHYLVEHLDPDFAFYYVTDSERTDLGWVALGRPDTNYVSNVTTLCIADRAMAPWGADDALDLFSIRAGAYDGDFEVDLDRPMTPGEVSIGGRCYDYSAGLSYEILASRGDDATVYRKSGTRAGGALIQTLTQRMDLQVELADGANVQAAGFFTDLPPTARIAVDGSSAPAEQLALLVHPRARLAGMDVSVTALPKGDIYGAYSAAPPIYRISELSGPIAVRTVYSDPFDPAWQRLVTIGQSFETEMLAPGATTPRIVRSRIGWTSAPTSIANITIGAPPLTPPLNFMIAGRGAFTMPSGVGLTPELTWDPPSVGNPSGYEVRVRRLAQRQTATSLSFVTWIYADRSPIRIPEGTLRAGERYVIELVAYERDGPSLAAAPNDVSAPRAWAHTVSEPFLP